MSTTNIVVLAFCAVLASELTRAEGNITGTRAPLVDGEAGRGKSPIGRVFASFSCAFQNLILIKYYCRMKTKSKFRCVDTSSIFLGQNDGCPCTLAAISRSKSTFCHSEAKVGRLVERSDASSFRSKLW